MKTSNRSLPSALASKGSSFTGIQRHTQMALFLWAWLCGMGATICWAQPAVLVRATDSNGKSIFGELTSDDGTSLEIVDLRTGKKLTLEKSTFNDLRKGVSEREVGGAMGLADFLAWKVRKNIPSGALSGKVASVAASTCFIALGSRNGVEVGQEFAIYRGQAAIKDPDTGELLGAQKRRIARLVVIEIQEKLAKCKVLGDLDIDVKIGDAVERVAQTKPIAILPFVDVNGEVRSGAMKLGEDITTGLSQAGVSVVERTLMDKVLAELDLQSSKVFDQSNAQKIGKQLGAFAVLTGTATPSGGTSDVNIRLIKTETGEILFATIQSGPALGSTVAGRGVKIVQSTTQTMSDPNGVASTSIRPAMDTFTPNSKWIGTMKNTVSGHTTTLTVEVNVLERSGSSFRIRFVAVNPAGFSHIRDIRGTIANGRLGWRAADVSVINGVRGPDYSGTLNGNSIILTAPYSDGRPGVSNVRLQRTLD